MNTKLICTAKSTDSDIWYIGYPLIYPDGTMSIFVDNEWASYSVIPETLKRFTGMVDCHNDWIYEGDRLIEDDGTEMEIIWYEHGWKLKYYVDKRPIFSHPSKFKNCTELEKI